MKNMTTRIETGPVQFDDDWPGIFIRGDNAMFYAMSLQQVLNGSADFVTQAYLKGLVDLLQSCDARSCTPTIINTANQKQNG